MRKRIVVTGATGFLGRHLLPILKERYGSSCVVGLCSTDFNLMDPNAAAAMLAHHKPEVLIHLAAYSGGIGANRAYPADFYYRNTMLTAVVFEAAAKAGVQKLLYTMGGCSYPANATSPISEDQMWEGFPQPESAGYSLAKKMGIIASQSYRAQYGLSSVVLIPGNMYGEYDNFRENESHVVPAMVRRYHEAAVNDVPQVEMWGSGTAQRDFVYARDVARTFPFFIEDYDSSEPVNISSGTTTSIRELAETIREEVDYAGKITWDTSKPDGQSVKIFDVSRLKQLGFECGTPLREGLRNTIDWFRANYSRRSDGIRV